MTPIDTVQSFLGCWQQDRAAFDDSLRRYMSPDCVYENVGLTKTTGPEEAIACLNQLAVRFPMETIGVKMLAIAAEGDTVFTERVDDITAADGTISISLRVLGVFKVRDGKICEWRDYFDTAPFVSG